MIKMNSGIQHLDKYSLLLTGGCIILTSVILLWFYKNKRNNKHKGDPQANGDTVQRYISSPLVLTGRPTYSTPKNCGQISRPKYEELSTFSTPSAKLEPLDVTVDTSFMSPTTYMRKLDTRAANLLHRCDTIINSNSLAAKTPKDLLRNI